MLTLDMAQRSDAELLAASLDQLVAADTGIAAVQACMALDGNLRQRYAKVGPAGHDESHASTPNSLTLLTLSMHSTTCMILLYGCR